MRYWFFILLLFFCSVTFSQDFKKHIQYLASDSLHGRAPDTNDELLAEKYINSQIPKKYKIRLQHFSFLQDSTKWDSAINIIASFKKNKKQDSTLILMAHYDGLGIGSNKSLEILQSKKKQIHNGADDNASGVAMVIELGKYLVKQKNKKYNIILLFTSAHEAGLFGAQNFVKNYNIDSLKIKAVFNFDMVGRLGNTTTLSVSDNQIDSSFYKSSKLNFRINEENLITHSDLKYFAPYNFHLINYTTGTHEDYHRITDDAEKINYVGMKLIYDYLKAILLKIQKQ